MTAADALTTALGRDPFELVAEIEAAAITAGEDRAAALHMERVRKVKRAEIQRAYRDAAPKRPTVAETEDAALTSPGYREHLDAQRAAEIKASESEARYYGLRNANDWLQKAADSHRAEAYLAR